MKIAFTTKGTEWHSRMDTRLGRTEYIMVYDDQTEELSALDNREIQGVAHGAGSKTASMLFDLNPDVLITGNGPGNNAAVVLQQTKMKIYVGAGEMTVEEAYKAWKNSELTEFTY